MKPRGEVIEIGEACGNPTRPVADLFDSTERRLKQIPKLLAILIGATAIGDVIDFGLGAVEQVRQVGTVALVAILGDPGASLHQSPQRRFLGHDVGVVARVGRGGHHRDQGVQVRCPADAPQQIVPVKLASHCDRVDRSATPVEVQDGRADGLVHGSVKVGG